MRISWRGVPFWLMNGATDPRPADGIVIGEGVAEIGGLRRANGEPRGLQEDERTGPVTHGSAFVTLKNCGTVVVRQSVGDSFPLGVDWLVHAEQ